MPRHADTGARMRPSGGGPGFQAANRLRCVSCHLDDGRRQTGSWVGVYARYPQYRTRSATVETIEYRINDCFRPA